MTLTRVRLLQFLGLIIALIGLVGFWLALFSPQFLRNANLQTLLPIRFFPNFSDVSYFAIVLCGFALGF